MKRCVVGIRRPGALEVSARDKDVPLVWFPSMATMAAWLSEDNQAMLRLICDRRPKSLTQLAELTGRQVPNLSRTIAHNGRLWIGDSEKRACAKSSRWRWRPASGF